MIYDLLKRVMQFVLLGLSQVLVFNGMDILYGAIPLIYVYFVIMFPRNYPKWAILLWSFAMGLTMDMFTNTPGVAAMSLTLIGAPAGAVLAPQCRRLHQDFQPHTRLW